jgi:hypothetical protein
VHIRPSIAPDLELVVAFLKLLRFGIKPMPNNRVQKRANRSVVIFLEGNNGDHAISRIPEAVIRGPLTNDARSIDVDLRGQSDDRDVAVRGRKLVPVDINKVERIDPPNREIGEGRG